MKFLSIFLIALSTNTAFAASTEVGNQKQSPKEQSVQDTIDLSLQSQKKFEEPEGPETPHWTDGVHIIAGLGVNASSFDSRSQARSLGLGLNLRSDVGYYFSNGMGIEFSASVMFNKIKEALLWNTTLATGLRFGLPFAKRVENFAPYGRILIGRATNVSIFDDAAPPPYDQYKANRIQLEGNMQGLGFGFFQRSSSGRIWYLELTAERHEMKKLEAVTDVNNVPVVVAEQVVTDNSELYALCLTFGLMVF